MTIRFEVAIFIWCILAASYLALQTVGQKTSLHTHSPPAEFYPLTITTYPNNATVKVMNIKTKYKRGMMLPQGRYDIEVSKEGYTTHRRWIELPTHKSNLNFKLSPKLEVIKVESR
ncbi:MAG: hypothetical protein CML20_07280 [Rheinheimera sp.]|uniref:carboxypeptidase-like regulatory domain-containing protein n=1 Tax=unclassified Pseudoalteromonas TaxID=194690 RepID=UPI000C8CAEF1|nr:MULTISPECIES: carboxypeptidase-like regulatory domain-containing protein [unclassified Pseudoalteromonas]MAD74575.1 hypothetical protein [Rheinheimera sp.]MDN3403267.1 carboxypeptidase-like regulatory domain-containing protein [Pseudoalteromonas sp. APC 3213]TMS62840.1 hypothetical protein CWC10_04680 [Pseudoalteromonas sp. S3173]|tara:strand:+ start:1277 stop:1624 length:348 start_codon:yes stop_codon:yes gene_type:complete